VSESPAPNSDSTCTTSDASSDATLTKDQPASVPPYWPQHARTVSNVSYQSITKPSPIRLEDHEEGDYDQSKACWAKHVDIDGHTVISGPTGIGAYVVWNIHVETLKGGPFIIRKRYSEFDELRNDLLTAFPHSAASIPDLPRKSVISRFRPRFLEQRRTGLAHFLNCVILNPEFAGSPILKDFIFS